MIKIATAHVMSSAPASAFFERWADMTTWPEWNADTEWVRLDGPFAPDLEALARTAETAGSRPA
jgi:hypothetical protein